MYLVAENRDNGAVELVRVLEICHLLEEFVDQAETAFRGGSADD